MARQQKADKSKNPQSSSKTDPQNGASELALTENHFPQVLTILPIPGRPFFPGQAMPVFIDDESWEKTIENLDAKTQPLMGLVFANHPDDIMPTASDFYQVGCIVRVHEPKHVNGQTRFIAEGLGRFTITEWVSETTPYSARVTYPTPPEEDIIEVRAFANSIISTVKELLPLNPLYSEELKMFLSQYRPSDPSPFADFVTNLTSASGEELQEILETVALVPRMEKVLGLIKKELDVARVQTEIRQRVDERITEQQRRFFLKEQLREIQKELGIAKDDRTAEVERFQKRIEALQIPEPVMEKIDEEMDKLSVLEIGSPEYAVTRNYLDWITQVPWGKQSEDKLDLARARKVLNEGHTGLDDIKKRILEFLAVGAYRGEISGSILLLVGPPGVGKTSIGQSIADALGRKFYRFSVGGMRDEAEIKGHRRTYIGALPGKLVQTFKEVGTENPVIMLDEIDKIGASYHGDPASALLEVLDPEQNSRFLDHYLDVRLDLSKVLFICTANQLDSIPSPLLDRMEIIHLAGYIAEEKFAIAKKHLWPRTLKKAGVGSSKIKLTDAALRHLISGYARESGVRGLEKQLGRIVRKAVVKLMEDGVKSISISIGKIESYLGKPHFQESQSRNGIGVVTGLAWTSMGGSTLDVEATCVHRKNRGLQLTGQLGDVMRESAEIAYSYLNANVEAFGADAAYFDDAMIHLHVPEGATPKDGPSAGITMATALLSIALNKKIKPKLAMTGELTLTGRVLAVGGIREKVIAARRVKINQLILPVECKPDFDELPDYLKEGLTLHFVSTFEEVAALCFSSKK